jgi:DNA-binding transcriptional ArsR family regulator
MKEDSMQEESGTSIELKSLQNTTVKIEELPTSRLLAVSDLFKILSDPTRLRLLHTLSAQKELCVYDLSRLLDMSQSATSHQLAQLRRSHLVRYRKEGKEVFYALDDEHVNSLLMIAVEHVAEKKE